MQEPIPLARELVLIGGGHTHALVLRRWGMDRLPEIRLTLINPGPEAPYTGMLPGYVAGHYVRDDLMIDLVRLARFAGARMILGTAEAIDLANRRIHIRGHHPVHYDIASINIGIGSGLPELPGFSEHAIAAKPLEPFATAWLEFRAAVSKGREAARFAIIGGGVGGAELSLAMAEAMKADGRLAEITVIERADAMPGLGSGARKALLADLKRRGILLLEGVTVKSVNAEGVMLSDNTEIPARFIVSAAGAKPQNWLASSKLELYHGFVAVDASLRTSDPYVFAAGDCAQLPDPCPKAGVFAVRQAPVLFHNLRAAFTGAARRRYRPQRDFLKLISRGDKSAVADKYGGRLKGRYLWQSKDRIDRRFMAKFKYLPEMPTQDVRTGYRTNIESTVGNRPLCGGCGAKIGGEALAAVLAALPRSKRSDIETLPGDDAAVLRVGNTRQAVTTDHLRAFTDDPWICSRIAAVHAMGDIWAMGAKPQAAFATVILPRMTEPLQRVWLAEIMAAASEVFTDAGAAIAGGHSSLGSELTIGFTVTGLLEHPAITLGGAEPGDALILTKPIGSGTILAAEMALKARGEWWMRTLDAMQRSQSDAAEILSGAHAMTDITGFGLAGHLMNICTASGVAAHLDLSAIPMFEGARELSAKGVRSTLHPENRKVASRMRLPGTEIDELLFDPQTAGGLLAAVPSVIEEDVLRALLDADYPATGIGRIVEGSPFIDVA